MKLNNIQELFAIVQHEQQLFIAQILGERGRAGLRDQRWVAQQYAPARERA